MRRAVPPLLWAAVIFITSSTVIGTRQFAKGLTTTVLPTVTEDGFLNWWHTWWWVFVKGYHSLEFAILTLLLFRAKVSIPVSAILALLYACTDEFHQTYIPGRGGRVTDVLIDSIGIAIVGGIAVILSRRSRS